MQTKKDFKEDRLRIRKDITTQLWQLRQDRNLTVKELTLKSNIPAYLVESLELYGLSNTHISDLQRLAGFYDKYIKIELVDKKDL